MNKLNLKANWIWQKQNRIKDDKVIFRKNFVLNQLPDTATAYIAVDTKYWLYVNEKRVVFEGGLFRESLPGCGYGDKVELGPFLKKGINNITLLCWFYGNEGRNNIDSTQAGLLFQCEELGIYSDNSFKCLRHPAFYTTGEPRPAYLYGGDNIGFDGNRDIGDFTSIGFDDADFEPAQVFENTVWGHIYERPIPLIRANRAVKLEALSQKKRRYIGNLPYAMTFSPVIEVMAVGGEVLDIRSDRYTINGGPGDEMNQYQGHRIEYICKPGKNCFESFHYLFGEKIIVSSHSPLEALEVSYRESYYDTSIVGRFQCQDDIVNKLIEKAARTLVVCMRDNFMDCPDRERGQWIGDVSVQIPQTFFLLDDKAGLLAKKAIHDFIFLRKGDVLVGNVPGANSWELPAQSLNAIGQWGMISQYYKYSGDKEVLEWAFEPCVQYLKLWGIGKDGLVESRTGDWKWFDHLYNSDEKVLENAWYYSAVRFAQTMAEILKNPTHNKFLGDREKTIHKNFDLHLWKGEYYTSTGVVDDRANAMSVLSGLCKKENYESIRKILLTVFNSTVYMENYVLIALCEMGYIKDAYKRMVSRYYNLAVNENSTLWEDFFILGTKNHAWSGAPVTIAFKYFAGIDTPDFFESFTVNPVKGLFERMECRFRTKTGFWQVMIEDFGQRINIL